MVTKNNSTEVKLIAADATKVYDGTALEKTDGVTWEGLPEGFTVEATSAGTQTNAGSSANVVNDGYVIKDGNGADQTANFTKITKVDGTLTVTKAPVTITTGSASKAYDGSPLTKDEASITGLKNGETATVTATGSQTEVGESDNTYSIDWGTANAANYEVTSVLGKLTVTKSEAEVILTAPSANKTYDGTELEKKDGVTADGLPAGFTIEATASGSQTNAGESANVVNDGYVIKDGNGVDQTANFTKVTKVDGTLTVTKAPVTITTGSATKEYDGTALTKDEANITELVNDETATVKATGSQTEVGSSTNTYSIDWGTTNKDNYEITEILGTLEVTKNATSEVKLIAADATKVYDGTALEKTDGVTWEGLPAGFTVEATSAGSQTNAGESANVVNDGYVIKDGNGADQTANFTNVTKVPGKLTVTKAPVTIKTGSATKEYDGTALTKDEANITGLVNGETATVTATGSQTEVGSSSNTYSIDWGTTNKDNYEVTESLGSLNVTTNTTSAVKLIAADATKVYDGTALEKTDGVTWEGLPEGFTVVATSAGTQTDAGESGNVVNNGYVIKDGNGVDQTANFTNVTKVDGTLKVTKAPVTITTGSAEKEYDGTPLTNAEASITGLKNGETATVKATGSQTEVGSSSNTYSIDWGTTNKDNYEITETLGTLEVTTNATSEVKLIAADATKVYDGTALEKTDGVTWEGLPAGFTVEATSAGSQKDAGSSANVVNDGYVIKDGNGVDQTANFTNVTKVPGTLTVTKAPVTITTGSDTKKYDGTPLTNAEASITGLVIGETATVTATGSQTEVGSSTNTYSIDWGTTNKDNYEVTESLGSLTVTTSDADVVLTAPSDTKVYDGTALEKTEGVTWEGLPEGFTVVATSAGSQTDAGESANVVNDGYVIKDGNGVDQTANFTNVTKVPGTLTVTKAPVTITTGSASKAYDGSPLTKDEASITGLKNGETATVTATGSRTEVGSSTNTYSIDWGTTNKDNYEVTESLGSLTVTTSDADVVLTAPSDTKVYDGTALEKTDGVTWQGLPEGFTVEATASGSQTNAGESANKVDDGYVIKDGNGVDQTANFTKVAKVDGTLTVTKAPVTITTGSASKAYDGSPLTNDEANITGLVNDETATVTATGSQTEVGSSDNTYSIDWGTTNKDNYTVTETLGTLEVTKTGSEVTLTAPSDTKVYDGAALEKTDGVTWEGLPEGFTVEATATGTQTNAGSSANVVNDGYVIKDGNGVDQTANFTKITKVDGKLTVTKAPVTITTGSDTKKYDGKPLTNAEASITGLVNGETAAVTATGSQTEIGSSDNTYSIDWGTTDKNNYEVTEELGTLEVTTNDVAVTLTAPSAEKVYDGKALTKAKEVAVSGLPDGITAEASASGTQTNAGESANAVDEGYVFRDANGKDVTANFTNVKTVDGKLTVTKAQVTISTGSAEKAYDGTPLTNAVTSIEGLVNGETATVTATGSQTEIGKSDNTYSIDWGTANSANYDVTEELGTLEVKENDGAVTLTAPSGTKVYDGTALEINTGVTWQGLPAGFTVEATASGSQTNAGESANVVNDGYVIKDAGGSDKTANFTKVNKVDGKLTVTKAPVTITTGSDAKKYDGSPLTKAEADITGLVNGETATVTATGSQTEIGKSDNTYSIDWGTTDKNNYEVTEKLGTLEVSSNDVDVKLTAPSAEKVYDGKILEKHDGVSASGLPAGFTVEAAASGSQTNAGSSANVVDDGYVIKDGNGNNVTANFTKITKVDGTLTVTKAPVTITTGSDTKKYDGKPLTNSETAIEGLVNGETATVTATGSQTEVGSSSNTYSIDWGTTDKNNYEVTEELGTLEVTTNDVAVTLTAPSAEKVYDGKALTKAKEVAVSGLPEGITAEASASGSQTDAGESANAVDEGYVFRDADGKDVTANFTEVTKVDGTLTVTKAPVTITTGSDTKKYDGKPLTKAEANITGLVNGETAAVTATGSQTEVGKSDNTYSIDWGTTDKNNYEVTEELGTLEVTTNDVAVTLTAPSAEKVYDGKALTKAKEVAVSGLPEGITAEASASGSQTNAGESANVVDEGYVFRDADGKDVTANFTNVKTVDGKLTVTKAPVTITTGSDTKKYDGKPLTNSETAIEGLVNGETATVTATGSQTAVGKSDNTYSIDWGTTDKNNYEVTEELGTLEVTTNDTAVTLTAPSAEKVYDGKALTKAKEVAVSGLPEGITAEASASGSQTNAGESANAVDEGYVFRDADGKDVTANFTNVKTVDGKLTVTKAPVTITTGSDTKKYDGKPLTNSEVSITGLVNGETATVTATGSQTEVGSSDNTYSIDWGTTDKNNYEVTDELGKLEVTTNDAAVTLTAPSAEKVYDGKILEKHDGVSASGLPAGFTVEAAASGSQTNAGESANVVDDGYIIRDADGTDKTANFTKVTKVDGKLTVTKAPVTITTGSDAKKYDGKPLTKAEANITGLVNGETAAVTATGTQTAVGKSDNTYSIDWGTTDKNNYEVTEELGTLEVTTNDVAVTLTAPSAEKVYDGKALTKAKEVAVSGLPDGFTVEAAASGSQTDAGESANVVNDDYIISDAAGADVTDNFTNITKVDGKLTVTKAPVTITTGSDAKKYDGKPLTNAEASITGLVNGETATVTATGSQTAVGKSDNTYSIDWGTTDKNNYEVTEELGTLEVTTNDVAVTLTAPSAEKVYDGKALTKAKEVAVSGLPEGITAEASASGTQTDAGESANVVDDGYVFRDADGKDVTANFTEVTKVDGTLTVTKAPVTITTGSDTKKYDGKPLTNSETAIEGLVNGETATVTATGSQTEVGSSSNTYSIDWGTTDKNNYEVTGELGTLEVTTNDVAVTLTAPSAEKVYDGKALTKAKEVAVSGLPDGITAEASASGSQTNAGESANAVDEGYVFRDADGKDVTANFTNVKTVDGKLTVTKAPVTITTGSDIKEYDGTALTNAETDIEGLVNGETAEVTATGSQTAVGKSDNTYSIDWGDTDKNNYEVTDKLGTLEVTVNTSVITVTANSDSKTYDGSPLTNSGAEVKGLPEALKAEVTVEGSATNVADTADGNNKVTGIVIRDADGNDVTANFESLSSVDGTLTITARHINIEAGSASKIYDRQPLTCEEYSITEGSLAPGQRLVAETEGSQTKIGTGKNKIKEGSVHIYIDSTASTLSVSARSTFEAKAAAIEVTDNYSISTTDGTLTVVKGPTGQIKLDKIVVGKPKAGSSYTVGEKIIYKITVTNISDSVVTDITVKDSLTGDSWTIDRLDPGKSESFSAEYKVTDKDVKKGSVMNTATASGTDGNDDPTSGNDEVAVKVVDAAKDGNTKTGDDSNMALWMLLLLTSGLELGALYRRRRSSEE